MRPVGFGGGRFDVTAADEAAGALADALAVALGTSAVAIAVALGGGAVATAIDGEGAGA